MPAERRLNLQSLIGLLIALLSLPLISLLFRLMWDTTSPNVVAARELSLFAAAGLLLWLMRSEHLPLRSIGFGTAPLGRSLLRSLLGAVGCGVALVLGLLLIQLLDLKFGSGGGAPPLPVWAVLLTVLRAAVVEEFFYRGYAIEKLQGLLGYRWLAAFIAVAMFALAHYRQGAGGVLVALLLGLVLTVLYLWKRDLVATMSAHFIVDFVPNVLLPLFG